MQMIYLNPYKLILFSKKHLLRSYFSVYFVTIHFKRAKYFWLQCKIGDTCLKLFFGLINSTGFEEYYSNNVIFV